LLFSNLSFAQRSLRYENIVKKASEVSKEEAYNLYSDYLSLNLYVERANPHFQLAELASSMMRDCNPLKEYRKIKSLYEEARNSYMICKQYLTDNDVRRDQSFFPVKTSQRRLTAQDVSAYVSEKQLADSVFFNEISTKFQTYTSLVNAYYECMHIYRKICDENRDINEVYINWKNNELSLKQLVDSFDNIAENNNKLEKALNFSLKRISNFRTDGFSNADFNTSAEIWDYKSWAQQQLNYYSENILPVIEQASEIEQNLNLKINNINETKNPDKEITPINPKLLDKLKNLSDISSLYLEIEQKYSAINFLNIFYENNNSQPAYIYSLIEVYQQYRKITEEIAANYPLHNSKDILLEQYKTGINNYKQQVVTAENASKQNSQINYNKTPIPLNLGVGFYQAANSGYVTKSVLENPDGSIFMGGASINNQGFSIAYNAYSADKQTVKWLKTTDISKVMYDDCSMAICSYPAGVISLVSSISVSDQTLITQTIVKYDLKGAEKEKITLPEKNLPLGRYISYDEISETMLLAFYGISENWFQNNGVLTIQKLSKNNEQLFRSDIQLNGSIVGVFPISEKYILFGNYTEIGTPEGKKTSELGMFSIIIDKEGKIIKTNTYPSNKQNYGINVTRVSYDRFMITGTTGNVRQNETLPHPTDGEPTLLITDTNGELIYNF